MFPGNHSAHKEFVIGSLVNVEEGNMMWKLNSSDTENKTYHVHTGELGIVLDINDPFLESNFVEDKHIRVLFPKGSGWIKIDCLKKIQ